MLKAYKAYSDVKVTMFNDALPTKQLAYVATGKAVEDLTDAVGHLRTGGINHTIKIGELQAVNH